MNTIPDIIEHYINQYISDECVRELLVLKHDYEKESKQIDNRNRREGDRQHLAITGEESPRSVRIESEKLDAKYKTEINRTAHKHAEIEGVELIEWEDKKSVAQKSKETEEHLNNVQEKIESRLKTNKEKIRAELKQAFPITQEKVIQSEQTQTQVEQESEKPTENQPNTEITQPEKQEEPVPQEPTETNQKKEEITKDELKALLRQQLKYELTQNRDQDHTHDR